LLGAGSASSSRAVSLIVAAWHVAVERSIVVDRAVLNTIAT
jgi:hypothetical protein